MFHIKVSVNLAKDNGGVPIEKPQNIVIAVQLLWASTALGLVGMLLDPLGLNAKLPGAPVIAALFTIFINSFIIFKISKGRNWVRIVYLVLYILGLPMCLKILPTVFQASMVSGIISVANTALQAGVLFLVFSKPGSLWFSKNKPLSTPE